MRFERSAGITPSEKLLAELCNRSFLSLWSYPNLFKKKGKELCDLLVLFGNDAVIFSDKSCGYPNSGNSALDWTRWYRRSLADSAHQLYQAERWLRTYPDKVFLDAACNTPLPISLSSQTALRVHRVCIALGASERAMAETGKPDLTISTLVTDDAVPFIIGPMSTIQGSVHVLDARTLPILLSELSTTPDFLDYLRKKEELLNSGRFAFAESELDLMAYFLWNGRTFPIPDAPQFKLDSNLWTKVESDPQFLAGRKENEISYFWDQLLEYFTSLYMKEGLEIGNEITVTEYEQALRIMASETRFYRRILSKLIVERAERGKKGYSGSILPSSQDEALYVLLVGPGDGGKDHQTYRTARAEQLQARCVAAKAVQRDKRFIIGLGLDAVGVKGRSEDLIFMDTAEWSGQRVAQAERLRQELGYFIEGHAQHGRIREDEYPQPRP